MIGPARYWREIPQRYRQEAARCCGCDAVSFPPRTLCRRCGGREMAKTRLPREGRVESFSVVRTAPEGFGETIPYVVGLITLADGTRITAQVVDCDEAALKCGDPVRLELRRIREEGEAGIICYGYKFVPSTRG